MGNPRQNLTNASSYIFPATFAQRRLWFLEQLQPGGTSYLVPWVLRLEGPLDAEALAEGLNEIVRRHEVLRTTFQFQNGMPVQVVAEALQVPLPIVDLSSSKDAGEKALQLAREEARRPLDLEKGPLIRAQLLRTRAEEHLLLLTLHHIIFDGWSRRIFVQELATLYESFCAKKPSPLAPPRLQYADYSVWQQKALKGKTLERQLAYWKEQLALAPSTLELPTDRPRPAVQSFNGAKETLSFSKEFSEQLARFSREQQITLYMTLMAGFQALLSRYSGQDDIVVGTPIANRNRAELEEMIGFFANTLVIRARLADDPTFRSLLAQTKENALGAYANQDLPFEKLVEELRPDRNLTQNPLFQVLFSLQNAPRQAFQLSGLKVSLIDVGESAAKFDISVFLSETAEGIRGRFEYNTDLFDAATIQRMIAHYESLLRSAIQAPDTQVSRLPLLSPSEESRILRDWNATAAEYPREACLHDLIEQQAARTPDAIACVQPGEHAETDKSLTYRELNRRANQLAHFLKAHGVGPGDKVGIYIERSLEMMVGLLGIQKTGAAYVPLDPAYPSERVRAALEDAQPRALITQDSLLHSLPHTGTQTICIDSAWTEISQESDANPSRSSQPEDLIYVIFTSGSTGRPKGVQVRHKGVVNLLNSMAKTLAMGPADVFPALASFAFDMCIPELYLALVTGGKVVIGERGLAANGEELAALLRRFGATIVHATPTTWSLLLEAGYDGKGVKRVIGAEPLPGELCRRLLEADDSLYNYYGPTETTVWSAFHHFRYPQERVVVGRPLDNTQIYILDKKLQPVPIGVVGEIHIGGTGVAAGYLNQPELTSAKFISDPFTDTPGALLYKTGDLGRYLPNGNVEFQGRADQQVKIRGYRIELGEIESTLAQHPAVQECIVSARADTPGDKRLVGYIIPAATQKVDSTVLRAWLKERLPEYMVPVAFVEMERFPLSPNGKVDRKALPAPNYDRRVAQTESVGGNPTEEIVAGIWEEVLKIRVAGVHENFFELGGHSLLATQVVSRIRQSFSIDLPLRALFEAPTIAGLAEKIEVLRRSQSPLQIAPLTRVPRNQQLPLSFAQQRLFFLDKLEPDNALYNVPLVLRVKGELQAGALNQALNRMVARHESLRTRFVMTQDGPIQLISPELTINLEVRDLDSVPAAEREAEARRLALTEVETPFNLETGPLLRARLFRISEANHVLVLNTHHIISDRWSMGVLQREVMYFYEQEIKDQGQDLAALPLQYADYAVWQRQLLSGELLAEHLSYWKENLSGAPASLDLPTDRPRPPEQSFRGAKHTVEIDSPLLEGLKALGRREGATLFMSLLAAFNVLLSRYSGQDDVVVGSPVAGRTRPELEGLIGFFVNTLVLRTKIAAESSFRELLAQVRRTALDAYAHQEVPFERLVEELKPERDLSRNPVFQVMFILQNVPSLNATRAGMEISGLQVSGSSSKFDLTLIAAERPQGLRLTFEYNTDLFEDSTIKRMAEHFRTLLSAVVADPNDLVVGLPLLDDAERHHILHEWNATAREFPRDLCVHDLIAKQARITPDAIAVECGEEHITYAQLDANAERLAQHLRAKGLKPETLVGIYLKRSIDMVTALLGVLKAGGAYVPLDPVYPPERIRFIVEDAQIQFLLTEAALALNLPASQATQINVRDALQAAKSAFSDASHPQAAHLAYVLYTSGSTGKPKGVQITHSNLVNFVTSMQQEPGFAANDTLLAVTTISFDIAGLEIYLPLISGGKVTLASHAEAADGRVLLDLVKRKNPTVMQATPATWRMLIEAGWNGSPQLKVLCGGEALPSDLAAQLLPRCRELWNMYGPTETTIWSSVYRVNEIEGTAPIGRPIANTTFYILDAQQQPVPVGVPGELYIGGEGVARGYLRRPELTAERFVPDPFRPGQQIYRTGDLARYMPDGNVLYLGRSDSQVKLRGFRIELGEIESQLALHPSVQQAVVAAREDAPGDMRLVAYVVAKPDQHLDLAEARAYLRQNLPDYMLPSAVVELSSLPLTPSGKVNRNALPAPIYGASTEHTSGFIAPRTPTEEIVAGIWTHVLKLERVGVHDNFFEIGGHSLLAMQVVSRLSHACSAEVPVLALFEEPTVAGLAHKVELLQANKSAVNSLALRPIPRTLPLQLSFAQQRLWFLDRLDPRSALYNVPLVLRLKGTLKLRALRNALNRMLARHESLRTWFRNEGGAPVQMITPSLEVDLGVTSVMSIPERVRETEARRLISSEVNCPFDLATGPLIRILLVEIAQTDHVLVINTHHTISDRWSLGVLRDELIQFYEQEIEGNVRDLAPLPIQYADYAAWQRQLLSGEALEEQLRYWEQKLQGAPSSLDLPADRPRSAEQSYRGASSVFEIPRPLTDQLLALGRREGATLFMTLLAAFDILLSRYSGQDDVVVGSPIAGRSRPELDNLIGFFVNTLVLRTQIEGNESFRQLLDKVRATAMGAYAHQDVPFEKLVEELNPERDLSRNPLFQVMFTAQNSTSTKNTMGELEISGMQTASTTSKFDLTVTATERASGLRLVFEYATDLFEADRIQRMQRHWLALLEGIVENPDCPIAELPLMEAPERQQVLVDWNATTSLSPSTLLHQFVEQQTARTPDAVALIDGTKRVSYRELNSRANQLARKLQKLGVGPEVLVAVFIERCADMIVALLAVLKSGGAYVPLDPMYPKDRVAKILEDSHAKVMITQEPLTAILPSHSAEVIFLDRDWSAIAKESDANLGVPVNAQNLAYVLFTSGSTGRPKGVALEHRSASIFVQWAQTVFTPEELSGTLFGTSICFDLSIFEMFVPLSVGGTVIIAQNALALRDLPAANEVRLINTVPSAIAELLRMNAVPSSVLTVNLAGEALPETLAREIYEQTSVRRLYNLYGPTEDTTYSTYTLVPRTGEVTIGRPIANTQAYILDARRQPVPIGVPGELYLAGDGLARGYYGRDDLTAERFVANPFSKQPNARMYRTGDSCRYRANGAIEYLGRIDNQVKLRGFRIELGEIESLLAQHPSIQQGVVVVREDRPGDKRLIGYVVRKPGQHVSVTEVRESLRQALPDYMVPATLVELEALPLTPNGKIDRKALPKPDLAETAAGATVAPRNRLEEGLLAIWQRVLQNPRMGVTDNFFDLGGHSLMAAQLVAQMEKTFGRKVPLAALFRGPTVEEMARVLRQGTESAADPIVMRIQPGRTAPFFAVVAPGMDSIGYAALAQAMGPQQTFYKLQAHRAVKPDAPITLDDMREIARDYVQAMRTVQPTGPYYLGGMCAGTHIGEQMILQLEAEGEKIALFAIFDTWVRQNSHVRWKWDIHYYRQRMRGMLRLSFEKQLRMMREILSKKLHRFATLQKPAETSFAKLYWPGKDFKTPHFQAPVALFKRPRQPFYYIKDEAMGWGERSQGGVHIYRIDFPHQMLREPYVRELAKRLLESISRATPAAVERLQVWPKISEPDASTIDVEA